MSQRKDHRHSSITETFGYDNMGRLTMSVINVDTVSVSYLDNGNIDSTSELGEYSYETAHPHAVTGISGEDSLKFPAQNISYTSFNMVDTLRQGDSSLVYIYGPDYGRKKMISTIDYVETTKYYSGAYEKIITPSGTRELHYIGAYGRIIALYEITDTTQSEMYYVHTDHLGSINCITNANDSIVQETSFTAWGRRRNPSTWEPLENTPSNLIITRGYTGHEHIDEFNLINMNGRIYDPVLWRFLSPDPFVANPSFSQDYNRYSYVLNNPLKYSDPSGYLLKSVVRRVASWLFGAENGERGQKEKGGGGGGKTEEEKPEGEKENETTQGDSEKEKLNQPILDAAPKQDFSGFWGKVKYILTEGKIGYFKYDIDGNAIGFNSTGGMGPIPGGFKSGSLFIKGLGSIEKGLFHSSIKPDILQAAGNFSKIVGKNPNVVVKEGQIILQGTGPYSGKVYQTGLKALDFFGF